MNKRKHHSPVMRFRSRLHGAFLLALTIAFFLGSYTTAQAAVVPPSFSTLPINQSMISTAGKAGSAQGKEGFNYVQINDSTTNSSGAVWFNNPISFTRDFHLEMAFFIENTANDSDGLAFVMQSSGPKAIAADAGSTLGVWATITGTDPLNKGAIPNSIAIEFDTYYNNDGSVLSTDYSMDKEVTTKGHHIAWAYPGANSSYKNDGIVLKYDKVLHHNNTVGVTDLSDGKWHTFIVDYNKAAQQFHYAVPDFNVDVTIPVDATFKSNLNLTNGAPVYFGFTGANGGYAQNKAVSFVDVQGLVNIDLRTGIFQADTANLLLDTEFEVTEPVKVDATKEITYATYINYDQTSDLATLRSGIKVTLALPENLVIVDNVYFGNADDLMTGALPSGGTALEYTRDSQQLTAILPEMTRGNGYLLHFTVRYQGVPKDTNIEEVIPAMTIFNGNAFVSSRQSGGDDSHVYTIKGILPPSLTAGAATVLEAQKTATIQRQNRNVYTQITLEDKNSTQAQLFISDFYTQEKELTTADFSQKAVIQRSDLSDPFQYTLELDTSGLTPGTHYYFAGYVVDTEGNSSPIHYFAIDFRGIVQLLSAPESLMGKTVTINELARAMDSEGWVLLEVSTATSSILEISNTSEGTWQLSGQTTAFLDKEKALADEVQLVLYDPDDHSLFCTITSDKKVLFEANTQTNKHISLDLTQYDCYLRFAPQIDSLTPGTYQGNVNWQLDSTITD